tara:strand:- start:1739 stop:2326 length:588 start_codon:yes stop_codon:yes gene_type:complete
MDLSKYSVLKIKTPIVSPQSNNEPIMTYNLEAIRTIDGKLLRETISPTSKYIKLDHIFLKINPKYTAHLFNNIKKALSYNLNNITDISYTTPIQSLQDHYIAMLSNNIFKDHTIIAPFKNLTTLIKAIEEEIDNMIYKFLDMETYDTDPSSLKSIVGLLNEDHFILNFQCLIRAPPSLKKYNIKDTIWNIHVLVD